jgi:hypothetical protein
VENIWQFHRQNYLANRVYETYETIVDACCAAWNALVAAPETIRSIASRAWAENPSGLRQKFAAALQLAVGS